MLIKGAASIQDEIVLKHNLKDEIVPKHNLKSK